MGGKRQGVNKMSAENLATVILGVLGVVLQLVFRYVPKVQAWYSAQTNKGAWMLLFVVLTGAGYFGLSCTPYAAQFGISLSCDQASVFTLLKALFIMASTNQLTYLISK